MANSSINSCMHQRLQERTACMQASEYHTVSHLCRLQLSLAAGARRFLPCLSPQLFYLIEPVRRAVCCSQLLSACCWAGLEFDGSCLSSDAAATPGACPAAAPDPHCNTSQGLKNLPGQFDDVLRCSQTCIALLVPPQPGCFQVRGLYR